MTVFFKVMVLMFAKRMESIDTREIPRLGCKSNLMRPLKLAIHHQ